MKSLATKREFIPNTSPPNCMVDNQQAQTIVTVMLWSSSSSIVDATDETSIEKINEYIKNFSEIEQNHGSTGYPILTTFLVPPSYNARHGFY